MSPERTIALIFAAACALTLLMCYALYLEHDACARRGGRMVNTGQYIMIPQYITVNGIMQLTGFTYIPETKCSVKQGESK